MVNFLSSSLSLQRVNRAGDALAESKVAVGQVASRMDAGMGSPEATTRSPDVPAGARTCATIQLGRLAKAGKLFGGGGNSFFPDTLKRVDNRPSRIIISGLQRAINWHIFTCSLLTCSIFDE
jgi:hypothetical protein